MCKLSWPLPALLAWAAGWGVWSVLHTLGMHGAVAAVCGTAAGALLALANPAARPLRRAIAAAGFPLSAVAAVGTAAVPAWVWLAALLPLLAAYPLRAWRDAPLFPTPRLALQGLSDRVGKAPLQVLDAGCGLGHGLHALRREFPQAQLRGIEWSLPLALACRATVPQARVRRGDMWAADWSGFDLVYLFQRPESMARAIAKAQRELRPGAWLVSLEFPAPGVLPTACLQHPGRKAVWLYRMGAAAAPSTKARARR